MKKFEKFSLFPKEDLKTGDLVCMRYDYSPTAAPIRYFVNLNKPEELRSPYNHIAMVVMVEGHPYIAEAKGSGLCKLETAITRLDNKKIAIRRPNFEVNHLEFNKIAIEYSAKGTKYDWKGTFWEQLVFQSTGYKKNKSEQEGDERLYCSEYYARVINRMFPKMYKEYYLVDPQDLYIDNNYDTIFEGKAIVQC